jgi:Flp pilus assembly protein TadD
MYQRTRQFAKAFDTYERVLVRRPSETRARYLIGRTAAISGERLDRAEVTLREYLRPRPDASQQGNASAHYLLGVIYEKRGEAEAAKREFDLSKKMDPQQAEARTIQRLRGS